MTGTGMSRVLLAITMAIGMAGAAAADPSPYAGLEQRPIKALSAEEIADLRTGVGLGMALAAELNRYPGPRHVLDLGALLALSTEQEADAQSSFEEMRSQAVPLGEAIIAKEAELDRLFASALADEATVAALTREIATLRGELRLTHLRHHLRMREVLSAEQIAAYAAARGYSAGEGAHHGQHAHGG